jgi:predicted O-methyltransferase YrrM
MRSFTHFLLWELGLADAETQTTGPERTCLEHHAQNKKTLAEIGVWHGVTTCRLRSAMSSEGILFAIDPYPVGRLGFSTAMVIAHREVSAVKNGSVEWVRDTGADAARKLRSRTFDFVFIDGDHTYEGLRADWQGWSERVMESGIIALHDSRSTESRPIDDAGSVRFTNAGP